MILIDFRPGTSAAPRSQTFVSSGVWRRRARPLARQRATACSVVILADFQRRGPWFSLIFVRARPRRADRTLWQNPARMAAAAGAARPAHCPAGAPRNAWQ